MALERGKVASSRPMIYSVSSVACLFMLFYICIQGFVLFIVSNRAKDATNGQEPNLWIQSVLEHGRVHPKGHDNAISPLRAANSHKDLDDHFAQGSAFKSAENDPNDEDYENNAKNWNINALNARQQSNDDDDDERAGTKEGADFEDDRANDDSMEREKGNLHQGIIGDQGTGDQADGDDIQVGNDSTESKNGLFERDRKSMEADPAELKKSQAYVQSIRSLRRPLTFLHIPKTAGTAIEYAAGQRKISWGSCRFNHKPKRDICHYPPGHEWPKNVGWWHIPRQFFPLGLADPYMGAEMFAVIRDPYERMVSEFYYICTLKVYDWRPDQCDRTKLFDKQYMNTWLKQKFADRDGESALSYLLDNGHFTPQHDFLFSPYHGGIRMIEHILRLDSTLPTQFDRLMTAFHLKNLHLKKLNALGAEARGSEKHLEVKDFEDETMKWIHRIYSNDFSELGFNATTRI